MKFARWFDYLVVGMAYAAGGVLIYLAASVNYEVAMRYLFNRPTLWVGDFAGYAVIYLTFLATPWVLAREAHIKIELLVSRLPSKGQCVLGAVTSVAGAVVCGIFFWYSLEVFLYVFEAKMWFALGGFWILQWPVMVVLPVGSLVVTLQFLKRAWLYARKGKVPERSS